MKRVVLALLFLFAAASGAFAQNVLPSCNWGDMLYRGTTGWQCVAYSNTAGPFLKSQGPSAAPIWSSQAPSTFLLPTQATNTALGNVTGSNASPVPITASQFLDTVGYDISRPPTSGALLFKDPVTSKWQSLAAGTPGQFLTTNGTAAAPQWSSAANISLNAICATQGAIVYRNATDWVCLTPGTSGQVLGTSGAAADPAWINTPAIVAQTANTIYAGPVSGASAIPTFRGLVGADLPNPSTTTLGGIQAVNAVASNWVRSISTSGVPALAQPSFSDISGTAAATQGGTGLTSYTQGDLLYSSAANVLAALPKSTSATRYLSNTGASNNPAWAQVNLADGVTGALPLANLATIANNSVLSNISGGAAVPAANTLTAIIDSTISSTQGSILYRNASDWVALGPGTAGYALRTAGAAANPAWADIGLVNSGTANQLAYYAGTGTALSGNANATISSGALTLGQAGSVLGSVVFSGNTSGTVTVKPPAAAGTTTFQLPGSNGTSGYVLQTDGAGVTSWVNPSSGGTVTSVTCGTGLTGGAITTSGTCAVDKATAANLEAGTSDKVLTADNIYDSEVTITYAASQTFDFNTFLNGRVTLTGDITSLTCSNIKASQSGTITLVQDGTGSHTMVAGWCSQFRWSNGSRGVLSTAANAIDALFYTCISTSICYVSLGKAQAN